MYGTEGRKTLKQDVRTAPDAQPLVVASDDDKKTKKQLVDELAALRQRVKDLEAFESERKAIASELKGTRQRLQYLLAVSPAIIYTTKATGDYACTFVSENLRAIMGYTPQEMTTDPKGWPDHLHPEDAAARLRRDGPPHRERWRNRRVPLPPSRRPLHLDPGHLQGRL